MAAPDAPVIKGRNQGDGNVRLQWDVVPDAAYYSIYEDTTSPATTEYDQVLDAEQELGGYFVFYVELLADGLHYFNVTAYNDGDEESDPSNELHLVVHDSTADDPIEPTHAQKVNRTF